MMILILQRFDFSSFGLERNTIILYIHQHFWMFASQNFSMVIKSSMFLMLNFACTIFVLLLYMQSIFSFFIWIDLILSREWMPCNYKMISCFRWIHDPQLINVSKYILCKRMCLWKVTIKCRLNAFHWFVVVVYHSWLPEVVCYTVTLKL